MHQDREIRQESYLATKYEKARQDVGLFLLVIQNVVWCLNGYFIYYLIADQQELYHLGVKHYHM